MSFLHSKGEKILAKKFIFELYFSQGVFYHTIEADRKMIHIAEYGVKSQLEEKSLRELVLCNKNNTKTDRAEDPTIST